MPHLRALERLHARLLAALGIALAAAPGAAFGPDPTTAATRFRFVVINDAHLNVGDLGVSRAQLRAAVDEINTFAPNIAFVLVAGDLGQSETASALQTELQAAKEELNRLAVPYRVAIGNHDVTSTGDDSAFRSLFGATSYRFEHDQMQFVCMRTAQTQTSTAIPLAALDSLDVQLAAIDPARPLVVLAHHPLGPLTPFRASNASAFWSRVDAFDLKAVITGHFHGVFEEQRNGAWYCTSSALAAHRANHDDTHEKGYRLVTVLPDWSLASRFYPLGQPPVFAPSPPTLQPIGGRYATPGRTLRIAVSAREPDGDVVTFGASGLPAGAAFDPIQRLLTWTPTAGQVGLHTGITFTTSDADGPDSETIAVRVLASACLYDDFSPQQPGWSSWGGSWVVAGGEMQQSLTSGGSHYSLAPGSWTDFHFEADLLHEAGTGYAGVVFRYAGANDNYYLWNDGARIQLRKRVAGTVTQLGSSRPVGAIAGWHHVRVEGIGATFKVYWDGTLVLEVTDSTFTQGQVGAVCSQASARFDNFVGVGCSGLPNAAPVLQPVGDRTVFAGAPVTIDLTATDPESTPLVYSAERLPAGASFDPALHRLTWTPGAQQLGPWRDITFRVRDGELEDSERITLAVIDTTTECAHATFTSGATGWSPASGTWTVTGGAYRGTSTGTAFSALALSPLGDVTIEARLRVEGNGSAGVAVRSLDATHAYVFALTPSTDEVELRKMNGGTTTRLAGLSEVTDDIEEWRWVRLHAEGARLRAWVDGALVYDYIDAGVGGAVWAAGRVGLQVQNATLFVDELVVTGCTPTASDVGGGVNPPPALVALTAAPNPFNPRTTVRFELSRSGPTQVTIYDAAGRRVRTLFQGTLAAGAHALAWEGDADSGVTQASGVYFLRAATVDGASTHRLVLVK